MKPWSETLPLPRPCRNVRLRRVTTAAGERAALLEQACAESFERGRIQGERNLGAQLLQQRADLLQLQNGLLASLQETLPQLRRDCEEALVALALEAAAQLVAQMPVSVELLRAVLADAANRVEKECILSIRVHPADLDLLRAANTPHPVPSLPHIQLEPSAEVTPGGCLVETRFGTLDARRESKLRRLRETLAP